MTKIFVQNNLEISNCEDAKVTRVPMRTVRMISRALFETKNPRAAITHKNMEEVKRVRTLKFVKKVQQMVNKNLARSFVLMANKCSANTIRTYIFKEIRCQSYGMQISQMLNEGQRSQTAEIDQAPQQTEAPKGAKYDLVFL